MLLIAAMHLDVDSEAADELQNPVLHRIAVPGCPEYVLKDARDEQAWHADHVLSYAAGSRDDECPSVPETLEAAWLKVAECTVTEKYRSQCRDVSIDVVSFVERENKQLLERVRALPDFHGNLSKRFVGIRNDLTYKCLAVTVDSVPYGVHVWLTALAINNQWANDMDSVLRRFNGALRGELRKKALRSSIRAPEIPDIMPPDFPYARAQFPSKETCTELGVQTVGDVVTWYAQELEALLQARVK